MNAVLLSDVEPLDQVRVALRVFAFEVVEQAAAFADEHQQPAARMMILGVCLEVFGQVIDAFAENGDLHFGRPGVGFVRLVAANQLGLAIFGQRHTLFLHERSRTGWWLNGLPTGQEPDTPYLPVSRDS